MLILFTEIFIVTFINDCAVTTIFTISLLRLRSVNLLFNKRMCVTVCVCVVYNYCVVVMETGKVVTLKCYTCSFLVACMGCVNGI